MNIEKLKVKNTGTNLSLFFGGDTLLGSGAKKWIEQEGYEYCFKRLDGIYENADMRVINLESPVCENAKKTKIEKQYKYKMSPNALDIFQKKDFNVFMLANNHMTDCGMDGLDETLNHLNGRGFLKIGAGHTFEDARKAIVIEKEDICVGLLNYMIYKPYYEKTLGHFANESHGGVNLFTEAKLLEDIASLRQMGVTTVIVSIHWGANYKPINKEQKRLAKLIIESGADVIIGHGPHQYQPIYEINGKLVFYSIGNFIFNTPGRMPLSYGFPVTLYISKKGIYKVEIFPIATNNQNVNYQPTYLKGLDSIAALNELYENSVLNRAIPLKSINQGVLYLKG